MRTAPLALFALLLPGCSTIDPVNIENRVSCSYDGKEAYVVSKWWSFSIGSQLAKADAAVLCKKERE